MIEKEREAREFMNFILGVLMSAFFTCLVIMNNASVSSIAVEGAILKCKNANTELKLVYSDGDFMCKDGAFYDKKEAIKSKRGN